MDIPPQQPVPTPGTLSPDGRYQWNGYQWVLLQMMAVQPQPSRGRGCKIVGGCALAGVVIFIALIAVLVYYASSSPLASFPVYPGATTSGQSFSTRTTGTVEDRKWVTSASVPTVEKFYLAQLDGKQWALDRPEHVGDRWASTMSDRRQEQAPSPSRAATACLPRSTSR